MTLLYSRVTGNSLWPTVLCCVAENLCSSPVHISLKGTRSVISQREKTSLIHFLWSKLFIFPSESGDLSHDLPVTSWHLYPWGHYCHCDSLWNDPDTLFGLLIWFGPCTSVYMAWDWPVLLWIRWSQMALWFSEFGCCDMPLHGVLRQQEAGQTVRHWF